MNILSTCGLFQCCFVGSMTNACKVVPKNSSVFRPKTKQLICSELFINFAIHWSATKRMGNPNLLSVVCSWSSGHPCQVSLHEEFIDHFVRESSGFPHCQMFIDSMFKRSEGNSTFGPFHWKTGRVYVLHFCCGASSRVHTAVPVGFRCQKVAHAEGP